MKNFIRKFVKFQTRTINAILKKKKYNLNQGLVQCLTMQRSMTAIATSNKSRLRLSH